MNLSDIALNCNNYASLRHERKIIVAEPTEVSLGASLPWIERHSDTCITSARGVMVTDTDTILSIFPDAFICPVTFSIVLQDSKIVAESHHTLQVMQWIAERNGLLDQCGRVGFYDCRAFSCNVISKPSFVINTRWSASNYYHWLHECLPRLVYSQTIAPLLPFEIQLVWMGHQRDLKPYHIEALAALKISTRAITFIADPCIFKNLVHLSFVDPGLVSPFQACLLKNSFQKSFDRADLVEEHSRLLVLRKKDSFRHLELSKGLRNLIEKYKLRPTVLEHLSFSQQVHLFSKAQLVISPHGAGLSNIVFCGSCTVLEIMPSDSIHPLYMQIASSAKLEYNMLVVKSSRDARQRLNVNTTILGELLELHFCKAGICQ